MNNPSQALDEPRQTRALARFAAVQMVEQARRNAVPFYQALAQAAAQAWDGRFYSARTIEDWYYGYRHERFGALQGKARADKGVARALDASAVEALVNLRREHPDLTLTALSQELVRRGVLEPGCFSASTLYRRLAQAGLDRRSLKAGSALSQGPTKAFELPLPNLLWMADCMYGPTLVTATGHERTFLFALLDDCSRVCVHAQYYCRERLEGFLDTLRQAVRTRGIPDKLYTDNGAAFKSLHLGIVCANLGIRLIHCKPYHSWSKGKIERFFLSVQTQFQSTLSFEPVASIPELNRRFWQWLETQYHQREHSALQGESPAQRFARLGTALRLAGPDESLDALFLMRVKRRVRKDATFSLGGRFFEVPTHLRGQLIEVDFEPVGYTRVEVRLGGRRIGAAHLCNKQRNARFQTSGNDYEPLG
jgi:transposase InsO family protein